MSNDPTTGFHDPAFAGELTDLMRAGARRIIWQAVQAALEGYLATHDEVDASGGCQLVRNGYFPEREVLTGVGPIPVLVPKPRDRSGLGGRVRRFPDP